jgi:hypothetical protein
MATQHVLQGTLHTQVQADITHVGAAHIKFHLGRSSSSSKGDRPLYRCAN